MEHATAPTLAGQSQRETRTNANPKLQIKLIPLPRHCQVFLEVAPAEDARSRSSHAPCGRHCVCTTTPRSFAQRREYEELIRGYRPGRGNADSPPRAVSALTLKLEKERAKVKISILTLFRRSQECAQEHFTGGF